MKKGNKRKNQAKISESDIQRRLYGEQKKAEQEKVMPESKINEKEIQKKLYGEQKKTEQETAMPESKINEKKIQKKLYGSEGISTPDEIEQKQADLFSSSSRARPSIQDEIDSLKLAISNLEEKLKKSESQKERLKVKLVQKRKLTNIREAVSDLILNRMPEKFIVLLILIIIAGLIFFIVKLKPKTYPEKPIQSEAASNIKEAPQQDTIKVEKTKPSSSAIPSKKKYTIQAAEYADKEAAQRFVDALQKQGYNVIVDEIYRGDNKGKAYLKINIGTYDTFNEAKKFNDEFKKNTKIKDSFIKELKR